jgi:hypothetical protein
MLMLRALPSPRQSEKWTALLETMQLFRILQTKGRPEPMKNDRIESKGLWDSKGRDADCIIVRTSRLVKMANKGRRRRGRRKESKSRRERRSHTAPLKNYTAAAGREGFALKDCSHKSIALCIRVLRLCLPSSLISA